MSEQQHTPEPWAYGITLSCAACAARPNERCVMRIFTTEKGKSMKVCEMNDCDWWIGESLEACKADYIATTGDPESVDDDAHELTDAELDRLMFTDCDEDERPTGVKRPFREQLAIEIAEGGKFPRMFASTEY